MITVNATLHARTELVQEFKAGQQLEQDPNDEIGIWHDRELKLVMRGVIEEEVEMLRIEIPQSIVEELGAEMANKLIAEEQPAEGQVVEVATMLEHAGSNTQFFFFLYVATLKTPYLCLYSFDGVGQ